VAYIGRVCVSNCWIFGHQIVQNLRNLGFYLLIKFWDFEFFIYVFFFLKKKILGIFAAKNGAYSISIIVSIPIILFGHSRKVKHWE
jgi:hypothetical protein